MDAAVIAALAKWPNVPAVFGWLRLDRRGNWLIREQQIRQPTLAAASATPWAWLPAEAQITPRLSLSADRWTILL